MARKQTLVYYDNFQDFSPLASAITGERLREGNVNTCDPQANDG